MMSRYDNKSGIDITNELAIGSWPNAWLRTYDPSYNIVTYRG